MAGANAAGSATAGTSPVGSGPCIGTGQALPVLLEEATYSMNGISLTGDELELYYARGTNEGVALAQTVVRRTRASKTEMFGDVELLPELATVCEANQHVNPDVTDDGLALYVTCTPNVEIGMSEGVSPLRVARRPDRSSPFTLAAEPAGGVFASASISSDELQAYSNGEIFSTAPQLFTRLGKMDTFGAAQPVPGISAPLNSPDISSDGLLLFGTGTLAGGGSNAIQRAVRTNEDAAFGALEPLELQLPAMAGFGAPTITPSCTLYVIVVLPSVGYTLHAALLQ
jgi:hypothetical protein